MPRKAYKAIKITFTRNINDKGSQGMPRIPSTYDTFVGALVDGQAISEYSTEKGSLIIKLNDTYLNKLTAGTHTLTALFSFGGVDEVGQLLSSDIKFVVKEKEEKPKEQKSTTTYVFPRTGD